MSADHKLKWARGHLALLAAAQARLQAANSNLWPGTVDLKPGEQVVVAPFVEPDREWSLIIGDCVQNLRSALDHAVWSLTPTSKRSAHPERPQFPIFIDKELFDHRGRSRIAAIPPSAGEWVEKWQPFASSHPTRHPLWLLNELSRIDKHRAIHVVAMALRYSLTGGAAELEDSHFAVNTGSIHSVMLAAAGTPESAAARLRVAMDVAFADTEPAGKMPVIPTLESMADTVEAVLRDLGEA